MPSAKKPPPAPQFPIFDGHNDVLLRFALPERRDGSSFFKKSDKGHLDLPRAKAGGLAGGFFAVYIPQHRKPRRKELNFEQYKTDEGFAVPLPPALKLSYSQEIAMATVAALFRLEAESKGQMKVVRTVDEIETCLRDEVLAAILHFEGAEAIDKDLNALAVYHRVGLRSLGPVWSRPTIFGNGVPFRFPHTPDTGDGLTSAGKALVKACNQLGILIDLSHINEKGFWDVAKLSDAPLVATHSNVHKLCRVTRNLTDKQLAAIKESDGMVGLNFAVGFLREDGAENADTPIETMVRHITYLVKKLGIDRVGFGSDFDGATVPQGIKDAAGLPKLVAALQKAGYNDEELRKITHQNWLRVLRKTWKD
jgi:membrane dipeptidase